MNKKITRIIAGICFLLHAGLSYGAVYSFFLADVARLNHFGSLLLFVAALVVGIGLLINKPIISAAGGLIFAVGYFLTGNLWNIVYSLRHFTTSNGFLLFASSALLIILCFARSASKILGIVSALLALIAKVRTIVVLVQYSSVPAIYYVRELLLLAGIILIGFAFYQKTVKVKKEKSENFTDTTTTNEIYGEGYCGLIKHILLLIFTCGIWHYIWIYRTTEYLNHIKGEEYRHPTKKLLLCMFVPFYIIYWTYKSAQRIDKLATSKGVSSDLSTLCLILEIFVPIIPPILMQDKVNSIATAKNTRSTVTAPDCDGPADASTTIPASVPVVSTTEELKNFKELLDMGIITQEEFDAKKKQLLGL